jgi:dimethylhistidine N-methyltransferase
MNGLAPLGSDGPRLAIVDAAEGLAADFAADVRAGLTAPRKRLPCRWLYDARGSELFERICELPEYTLTRAESAILSRHANRIAALVPQGSALVELGSGSARKTRLIIHALLRRQRRLRYVPIDIAPEVLEASARALVADFPALDVHGIVAEYEAGLRIVAGERDAAKLVLWLGSNVGNFSRGEAAQFLSTLRRALGRDDRLLVGIDLRKDRAALERAYDDRAGVTAAFNLNLLARINRELDGEFAPDDFRHRVRWHERWGRIEMHLESRRAHRVRIGALGLRVAFRRGETIFTERSYKYDRVEIARLAASAGFTVAAQFTDARKSFAVAVLAPRASLTA